VPLLGLGIASCAPGDGAQNEPLLMYPCGQLPPGPWGFGTGRGSAWATVIMMTNTAMMARIFISLARVQLTRAVVVDAVEALLNFLKDERLLLR
jgi:hypothetical protein